ncbi:MAG: protein kinase [Oscillospiraceae bacterium]|jgi:serine/threonine protein kinase|nr:protein kinase [Oscillospiraceae bacterium]
MPTELFPQSALDQTVVAQIIGQPSGYRVSACLKDRPDAQVYLIEDTIGIQALAKVTHGARQAQLQREYEAMRLLSAPCFPKAYRLVQQENTSILFRSYIPGQSLASYAENRPLRRAEVIDLMLQACDIVQRLHAHTPPLVHRDIKPDNFIITDEGRLVLIDFEGIQWQDGAKTRDTVLFGTVETAAPEQYGAQRSDTRADIFGLGMTMLYLLTNDYDLALLRKARLPRGFRRIIRRCTRFDPAGRFADTAALARALRLLSPQTARRALAGAAALAAAGGLLFLALQRPPLPLPLAEAPPSLSEGGIVTFTSPAIEAAAAYQLGKEPGTLTAADLQSLTDLFLCADRPFDAPEDATLHSANDLELFSERIVERGSVTTLEDLRLMPNLQRLAIYKSRITDISALEGLRLQYLVLADNPIEDFSPITTQSALQYLDISTTDFSDASLLLGMPRLATLRATGTLVNDWSPLTVLPLETMFIDYVSIAQNPDILYSFQWLTSLRMYNILPGGWEVVRNLTALVVLESSRYPYEDLRPLAGMTRLQGLELSESPELLSLDGIDVMPRLEFINIRNAGVQDVSPLLTLSSLRVLDLIGVPVADYSPLLDIDTLRDVYVDKPEMGHFPLEGQQFQVFTY